MKKLLLLGLSLSFFSISLIGQSSKKIEKSTLAVTNVVATKSVTDAMKANGATSTFNRVIDALDVNLLSAFNGTRKFKTVTRGDLESVIKEQSFGDSGNVDNAVAAKVGRLLGARYIVCVSVDDFQDFFDKANFATLKKSDERRSIRIGAIAKLIDSTTGAVVETANIIVKKNSYTSKDDIANHSGGNKSDENIALLARDISSQIANRFADVIFPAKIIGKTGKIVTFNRSDSTGVSIGDEYSIFALGEDMIDPDTGENLGVEEISVGKMRVTEVLPKFSKGMILEDNGVDKGQILRLTKKAVVESNAEDNEI